jgi:hypothetical protein
MSLTRNKTSSSSDAKLLPLQHPSVLLTWYKLIAYHMLKPGPRLQGAVQHGLYKYVSAIPCECYIQVICFLAALHVFVSSKTRELTAALAHRQEIALENQEELKLIHDSATRAGTRGQAIPKNAVERMHMRSIEEHAKAALAANEIQVSHVIM